MRLVATKLNRSLVPSFGCSFADGKQKKNLNEMPWQWMMIETKLDYLPKSVPYRSSAKAPFTLSRSAFPPYSFAPPEHPKKERLYSQRPYKAVRVGKSIFFFLLNSGHG